MLWPEEKFKDFKDPERIAAAHRGRPATTTTTTRTSGSQAIREGKPQIALSNFDYAATLTEAMLLGNVAVRSGEAFDYDPESGQISDSPAAAKYLKPYFRKGGRSDRLCDDPGFDDCVVGETRPPGPRPRRILPVEARTLPPASIRFDRHADGRRATG